MTQYSLKTSSYPVNIHIWLDTHWMKICYMYWYSWIVGPVCINVKNTVFRAQQFLTSYHPDQWFWMHDTFHSMLKASMYISCFHPAQRYSMNSNIDNSCALTLLSDLENNVRIRFISKCWVEFLTIVILFISRKTKIHCTKQANNFNYLPYKTCSILYSL